MADSEVPQLNLDNAILQLTKHGFPATKWSELAVHLGQRGAEPSPQLVDILERWIAGGEDRSWRGLVDALVRCKEMVVAKNLAHEVKVPFPGAHHQLTPSKPLSPQHRPLQSLSTTTPGNGATATNTASLSPPNPAPALLPLSATDDSLTGSGINQQQQQQQQQQHQQGGGAGEGERGRTNTRVTEGSVLDRLARCDWTMAVEPALALVGLPWYYFIGFGRKRVTGGIVLGVAGYAVLTCILHGLRGSKPITVFGVKISPRIFGIVGGVGLFSVHMYSCRQ